jgi:hypothetical protein
MMDYPIPLKDGLTAFIDYEDSPLVAGREWHAIKTANGLARDYWYVAAFDHEYGKYGKTTTVYLHRLIARAKQGQTVRLRDGDGLNCRKSNLIVSGQSNRDQIAA